MNCPLCNQSLEVEHSDIYPGKSTYQCPNPFPSYFRNTHYIKYFEADWTYSRYREEAIVYPYRILNFYNEREDKTDFGAIQKEAWTRPSVAGMGIFTFQSIVEFDKCINLSDQDTLIAKIKTLLTFL